MSDSVYDTALVAKANGSLEGRRSGNVLDRRLALLEIAARGLSATLVNGKLLDEYQNKVARVAIRNEVIRVFLEYVIDHGIDSGRSTLSAGNFAKARQARWPSHDQHLLAAGMGRDRVSIYVTEAAHIACARKILRYFGFLVVAS